MDQKIIYIGAALLLGGVVYAKSKKPESIAQKGNTPSLPPNNGNKKVISTNPDNNTAVKDGAFLNSENVSIDNTIDFVVLADQSQGKVNETSRFWNISFNLKFRVTNNTSEAVNIESLSYHSDSYKVSGMMIFPTNAQLIIQPGQTLEITRPTKFNVHKSLNYGLNINNELNNILNSIYLKPYYR